MSIKKETTKEPPKEENQANKGGLKCRIYKAKIPQKLSRLRIRLNLPSQDDFVYSKNYGSGMPAFVLGEPKKT